jgi:coenzyme F420-reducing hydrogenase alpha subunit
MLEINTNMLTCDTIEYQKAREEYRKAKEEMESNVPTKERLKKLIEVTSNLAKIRKRIESSVAQA